MDYAQIFSLSGLTVMPFWGLMILLPRWRVTRRVMQSPLVAVLLALVDLRRATGHVGLCRLVKIAELVHAFIVPKLRLLGPHFD